MSMKRSVIKFRFEWHGGEKATIAEIENIVEDMDATVFIPQYKEAAYTGLEYGMEKYYPTWKIPEDHIAIRKGIDAYQALFGKKPKVDKWTFSTNAVTITGMYHIPAVGFGPGDEVLAHAPNEKVPIDDLVKAAAFYAMYAFKM